MVPAELDPLAGLLSLGAVGDAQGAGGVWSTVDEVANLDHGEVVR